VPGPALCVAAARRTDVVARVIRRCGRLPMIERPRETGELIRGHLRPLLEMSPVGAALSAGLPGPALRPALVASPAIVRTPAAVLAAPPSPPPAPAQPSPRREQGLRRELL